MPLKSRPFIVEETTFSSFIKFIEPLLVQLVYLFLRAGFKTVALRIRFKIDMKIAISRADPKPSMINPSPITVFVSKSISALTTNKNRPSVTIVAGNVKKTKIGRTIIFANANTILARIAVPMLSTTKLGISIERNRNNIALRKIPPNHFIRHTTF